MREEPAAGRGHHLPGEDGARQGGQGDEEGHGHEGEDQLIISVTNVDR